MQNLHLNSKNLLDNVKHLVKDAICQEDFLNGFSSWVYFHIDNNQNNYIKNRPTLGAEKWLIKYLYVFPDKQALLLMEDGHMENALLISYDESTRGIEVLMESEHHE